jgi:hypothetical protein
VKWFGLSPPLVILVLNTIPSLRRNVLLGRLEQEVRAEGFSGKNGVNHNMQATFMLPIFTLLGAPKLCHISFLSAQTVIELHRPGRGA